MDSQHGVFPHLEFGLPRVWACYSWPQNQKDRTVLLLRIPARHSPTSCIGAHERRSSGYPRPLVNNPDGVERAYSRVNLRTSAGGYRPRRHIPLPLLASQSTSDYRYLFDFAPAHLDRFSAETEVSHSASWHHSAADM
jgi:hypothetical protein